jgi:hypothetical protein
MNAEFPEHLVSIERRLWANDAVFYHDNLTDDCLLVFPETGVITRDDLILPCPSRQISSAPTQ